MNFIIAVIVLAIVQGLAELLPVSSSAHVIVAEKLLHMEPTSPENTLLLVMLHTGTMFAVIVYFWKAWKQTFFSSRQATWRYCWTLALASALTAAIYLPLKKGIERYALGGKKVETLFGNLTLIAIALICGGILIIYAGLRRAREASQQANNDTPITARQSACIGAIQGLLLPFRGFSRSGGTISVGLLTGTPKRLAEEFSFALAVILTPAAIAQELQGLFKEYPELLSSGTGPILHMLLPGILGMACSFIAGLVALQWLSRWLEKGRWHYFGYYCLIAAAAVLTLHYGFGY